jgi:hypothetical protein
MVGALTKPPMLWEAAPRSELRELERPLPVDGPKAGRLGDGLCVKTATDSVSSSQPAWRMGLTGSPR